MTNTQQLNTEKTLFQNATGKLDYGLTNDYMFRVIMQKNEKVLKGLLGSLLGLSQDEIVSVELTNPIIPGDAIKDKESLLDLRIILNQDRILNIEMQVAKRKHWTDRSLTYLCKNYDQLKSGQDYGEALPCFHIGIIDFNLFEEENGFYSQYRLLNVRNQHIYTTKFGINVLNLKRIDFATDEDRHNELDVWANLFKAKTWEEIKMLAKKHDFAKEAATTIYAVSKDEAIRLQCEARERYERDWAESYRSGKEDGREEGKDTERRSIITHMLSNGKTPEEIAEIIGLSLDEVLKYMKV